MKLITSIVIILLITSCQRLEEDKPYNIYWVHIEGAPVRTFFDQWLDPHGIYKVIRPEVELSSKKFYGSKTFLPKVWFSKGEVSPLLDNWINIRGIESSSPHLKEARKEWFSFLRETPLPYYVTTQTPKTALIYQQLLNKGDIAPLNQNDTFEKVWLRKLNERGSDERRLWIHILRGDEEGQFHFESTSTLNRQTIKNYNQFYRKLIEQLESFVSVLKKRNEFQKSVILITSDRNRIVTNSQMPFETTTLWQGLNFSLISGAIQGPLNIGHILREHPHYKDTLPGTWGLAQDQTRIADFQLLIQDLLDAPMFTKSKDKYPKNPWLVPKSFNNLSSKLGPGRVVE